MAELNNLYKCKHCLAYTARSLMYCHWCGVKLPSNELAKKYQNNDPDPTAKRLPKSYKKFGEK